jgi:hypothetical protein
MNPHPTVEKLLGEIEAFRDRTGLNATKFGQLAVNDGNFIRAIRLGGRTPSLATIDRVKQFMKEYKRRAA